MTDTAGMRKGRSPDSPARGPNYFARWRKRAGFETQDPAADAMGITQGQLSRFESGKNDYTQEFLEKAAVAYRITPALMLANPDDLSNPLIIAQLLNGVNAQAQRIVLRILQDKDVDMLRIDHIDASKGQEEFLAQLPSLPAEAVQLAIQRLAEPSNKQSSPSAPANSQGGHPKSRKSRQVSS